MKRFHVHLGVDDLQASIGFYSTLFAAPPTVQRPDYAKWMLEDPRINFAISHADHTAKGIEHIGIQAETADELKEQAAEKVEDAKEVVEDAKDKAKKAAKGDASPLADSPYGEGSYVGAEPPEGYEIKGNERSMKFHVPGTGGYERTNAEVWF